MSEPTTELDPMTESEARDYIDNINAHAEQAVELAAELKARQGYLALNYDSFEQMARLELSYKSRGQVTKEIEAKKIIDEQRAEQPELFAVAGPLTDPAAIAVLHKLPPDNFAEGWTTYAQAVGDSKNPVKTARAIVARLVPPKPKKDSKKDVAKVFGGADQDVTKSAEYLELKSQYEAVIEYLMAIAETAKIEPRVEFNDGKEPASFIQIIQRVPIAGIGHDWNTFGKKGVAEDAGRYERAEGSVTHPVFPED